MKVVGLTGGIGAGKSVAAERFREKGIPVINADEVAHKLIEPGGDAERALIETFGDTILTDGKIDRGKVAKRVFGNPEALETLNNITHPLVRQKLAEQLQSYAQSGRPVAIIEAALLGENGTLRDGIDGLILVECPEPERVRRLVEDRKMPEEEARRRIQSQTPPEKKRHLASWTIDNGADRDHLKRQVDEIAAELLRNPAAGR